MSALVEVKVTSARIQIHAWPLFVANIDLSSPASAPAPAAAPMIETRTPVQLVRGWCRKQVDHSVAGVSHIVLQHLELH